MNARAEAVPPGVKKLYQLLLLAYPRAYRQAYGPWMVQLFCDQYRAAWATPQTGARAAFWLHVLFDLIGSALREQAEHLWRRMMGVQSDPAGGDNPHSLIDKILLGLALFVMAAFFFWMFIGPAWGRGVLIGLACLFVIIILLFGARLQKFIRGLSAGAWLIGGLVGLALLSGPLTWLVAAQNNFIVGLPDVIAVPLYYFLFFIPAIALMVLAGLLYAGWKLLRSARGPAGLPVERSRQALWAAGACFGLGALLFAKLLHSLYWLAVWDSTYDPIEIVLVILFVTPALFAGALLTYGLRGKEKLAGLGFLLVVPAALALSYYLAKQVMDYRALTAGRAGQIAQAVEAYHAHRGVYPTRLGQLAPGYLLSIPGPVLIAGESWCYQGGATGYALGAVDRQHWSSPNLFGRLYASQGEMGDADSVCADEIEAMRARRPDYYGQR